MIIPLLLWVITLYGNGTATVGLNTTITGGQSITLALPVQPQSYIMVTVNGSPWYYILNGSLITVPIFGTANVSITYVPHALMENNFIGINVGNSTVEITIPSDVLIANITLSLINMTMSNNELIIIAKGPGGEFLYTVMPTSTSHGGVTTIQRKMQITPYNEALIITIIIIMVVIVAFAMYILIIKRRTTSTKPLTTASVGFNLNEYEVSILRYLESRGGGSAFEIDISRDLGIPRTTVWRSVRRLEGLAWLGLVRSRVRIW